MSRLLEVMKMGVCAALLALGVGNSLASYVRADAIVLHGDLNHQGYVEGNPLNRIDPLGLFDCGPGYSAISLTDRVWKCVPDGSDPLAKRCLTGECAAGILPTPKANPSVCEEQCGVGSEDAGWRAGTCAAISQVAKLGGLPGIPVTLGCKAVDKYLCMKKCEETRAEKLCKRSQ